MTLPEVKTKGYVKRLLKAAGVRPCEARGVGYPPAEMKIGGYSCTELRGVGCSLCCRPKLLATLPLARAGDGAFSRERGHARRVACGWDASRDGCGGRWEPIHRGLNGYFFASLRGLGIGR